MIGKVKLSNSYDQWNTQDVEVVAKDPVSDLLEVTQYGFHAKDHGSVKLINLGVFHDELFTVFSDLNVILRECQHAILCKLLLVFFTDIFILERYSPYNLS